MRTYSRALKAEIHEGDILYRCRMLKTLADPPYHCELSTAQVASVFDSRGHISFTFEGSLWVTRNEYEVMSVGWRPTKERAIAALQDTILARKNAARAELGDVTLIQDALHNFFLEPKDDDNATQTVELEKESRKGVRGRSGRKSSAQR